MTSWDSTKCNLLSYEINNNWIWTRFNNIDEPDIISNYINVYAPQKHPGKVLLWQDLQRLVERYVNEAYFILGDFNSIRNAGESTNCTYRAMDTDDLNNFITTNNLWEVPMENYRFTWFGPLQRSSRLDRLLLNQIATKDTDWKVKGMGRKHSDHVCLYLYNSEPLNWGPKPCKPFSVWLDNPEIITLIQTTLGSLQGDSTHIQEKLKKVRETLQEWNVRVKGRFEEKHQKFRKGAQLE